jgi:hypothetical protein
MHASRSLIALLVGTVAFFAVWIVALKPSSSGPGGAQQGLGAYQSAISKARAVASGHPTGSPFQSPSRTTGAAPAPGSTASGATTHRAAPNAGTAAASGRSAGQASSNHHHAGGAQIVIPGTYVEPANAAKPSAAASAATGFAAVKAAFQEDKVLALLFYNPSSSDDQAVHHELAAVPTHRGAVVKLAVPLQDLSAYSSLLNEVPVNFSPTLVLINRARQAEEITGYAVGYEIDQDVAAALGSSAGTH